jgi:CrcB protein
VALGPGVLGGFTTLSAYAEQGRRLVDDGDAVLAGAYLVGTLGACLVAVALVARWVPDEARAALAAEGGEE